MGRRTFKKVKSATAPLSKLGKEVDRGFNRLKEDPTSMGLSGVGVKANIARGVALIKDVSGIQAQEDALAQEQELAQQELNRQQKLNNAQLSREAFNRGSSGAVRIGVSSSLALNKTGTQI